MSTVVFDSLALGPLLLVRALEREGFAALASDRRRDGPRVLVVGADAICLARPLVRVCFLRPAF